MKKRRFLIIGAGISGLTAARALREAGHESIILEACPSAGGLTRSINVSDFCFDYTGHFLHLARFKSPEEIPYANLKNSDWEEHERKSLCYIDGQFITAPVQYHLRQLPEQLFSECVASYNERPPFPSAEEISFKDFIVSGFGKKLADIFLIPQNEKTLACSLDQISGKAIKRFFPPPDETLVRSGMKATHNPSSGYNSRFWYPRIGGIEVLVRGLKSGLDTIHLLDEAVAIDTARQTVRTRTGNICNWDILISSLPLPHLCAITDNGDLLQYASDLPHSSTIVFNLGIRAPVPTELSGIHWIYVPDPSIPFYRLGFYSNINHGMCSPECYSLYVEVGIPGTELDRINIIKNLQPKVLNTLDQLGWVKSKAIVCSVVNIIRCAYVHHTKQREQILGDIFKRLAQANIYPIGRYGMWDYISMEDSIISAIDTIKKLI